MFVEKDKAKENNELYMKVKFSAEKSFEEYYYSFCALSVFLLGAFVMYLGTRISKGLFLIVDLFLIYKILRSIYDLKKSKEMEDFSLENKMKFLNDIYKYNMIFLAEAITRHFLSLNIVIWTYLKIMVVIYGIGYIVYKVIKKKMFQYYIQKLSENNYEKIVSWKSFKHKMFVIASFLMFMLVVVSTMMKIVNGSKLLVLMTVIYTILFIVTTEIKCDLEIEQALLFKEGIFDFGIPDFIDPDDLDNYDLIPDDNYDNDLSSTNSFGKSGREF